MPQLFQVLKCYKCFVFQVHQTKKSNKWQCKLCGEKQSIKRHYGLGTGKECRLHVQKLNGIRGEIDELNESIDISKNSDVDEECEIQDGISSHNFHKAQEKRSKWCNFVDKTDTDHELEVNESMYLGNTEVVLEVPVKKRRKFNTPKVTNKLSANLPNTVNDMTETKEIQYHQNNTTKICTPDLDVTSSIFSDYSCRPCNKTSYRPKVSINQKSDNISKNHNQDPIFQESKTTKLYIPPKVNKDSKWAQFTGIPDENDNTASVSQEDTLEYLSIYKNNPSENAPNNLFTLCDENELDDVLDF